MAMDRVAVRGRFAARKLREVYQVEGLAGVARRSRRWLRKRRTAASGVSMLPKQPLPQPPRWHTHVLSIGEQSLPQCYHYRVQQKREICHHLGVPFDSLPVHDVDEALTRLQLASILIVYRLPGDPSLQRILDEAARLRIPVVYELDDLIYRREMTAANPNLDTLPPDLRAAVIRGSEGYHRALSQAQFNLSSTLPLLDDMRAVNGRPGFVVENGIDETMLSIAEGLRVQPALPHRNDEIVVAYGSGSRAHDHDFLLVASALARWLEKTPDGRLKVLGPVRIPDELAAFSDRIIRRTEVLAYGEYLRELSSSAISIAPLSDDPFNAFKSQVKYLESALVGVPLIASPMVYSNYIHDGHTGFLARTDAEWLEALTALADDPARRTDMARAAREHVRQWELQNRPQAQMETLIRSLSPVEERQTS